MTPGAASEKLLGHEETLCLIADAQRGDTGARDSLVAHNLGLVRSVVHRFSDRGVDPDDLFQIGAIGLLKAIDRFDCTFGVRFSTYAVPMIMGEIRRFLRDDGMIKVGRTIKERGWKTLLVRDELAATLQREPTIQEIAREMECSPEEIVQALDAMAPTSSIFDTVHDQGETPIYRIDQLCGDEDQEGRMVERVTLSRSLNNLDERERFIVHERYFHGRTQTEVAQKLDISQVQVSRIERRALLKIRTHLEGAQSG